MTACILTIGDEVLNGQTIDTNSAWIARHLNEIGFEIRDKISVGDQHDEILGALGYASKRNQLIVTTGGLGPTTDDVTKNALAEFFNDELEFHQPTFDVIKIYLEKRERTPTEAHRIQCFLPSKAKLVKNSRGTAPGMWFKNEQVHCLSMPGVPNEMKIIMEEEGLGLIKSLQSDQHIQFSIIQTVGCGETVLCEMIQDILDEFPEEISIAYLPATARVKIRLTAKGNHEAKLKHTLSNFTDRIVRRFGDFVYALEDISLEESLGRLLKTKNLKLSTAESCTGGHIAHTITRIAGSSEYFNGSVVAYSNEVKKSLLGVSIDTLEVHGAVSEQTVKEMLHGLFNTIHSDLGIAVSGIAGPSGGTMEKPVGTIWIAVGSRDQIVTEKLQLAKDRVLNINYTTIYALNLLRLFVQNKI